ncbi:MAG: VWA domain-containing protein, partial [Proteobacteria bacterium]|nr:VWA domain-containing protein [Pseudomonadota bacterium]
ELTASRAKRHFLALGAASLAASSILVFLLPQSTPLASFSIVVGIDILLCIWLKKHIVRQLREVEKNLETEKANIRAFSRRDETGSPYIRPIIYMLMLILMTLAIMGPEGAEKTTKLRRTPLTVTILFDLSRSMDARDITPSRLVAARDEVNELLEQSMGDEIGLVYFTDTAVIQSPQTLDVKSVQAFLNRAKTSDLPMHGTDLTKGLETALRTFNDDKDTAYIENDHGTRRVVLVTDGETHTGDIDVLIQKYVDRHIHVDVIAIGTEKGAEVPDENGKPMQYEGKPVISQLQGDILRSIAEQTDGIFVRYTTPVESSHVLIHNWDTLRISSKPRGFVSSLYRTQLYPWFLYPAYILLILFFIHPFLIKLWNKIKAICRHILAKHEDKLFHQNHVNTDNEELKLVKHDNGDLS